MSVVKHSRLMLALALCALLVAGCAPKHKGRRVGIANAPPPTLQEIESGDLRAEPGFTGDRIGVRILGVTDLPEEDLQAIDLDVPLDAGRIDRVEIFSPGGRPIEQPKDAEIKPLADPDNAGIRIFLPKRKDLEFRIKLIDEPDNY